MYNRQNIFNNHYFVYKVQSDIDKILLKQKMWFGKNLECFNVSEIQSINIKYEIVLKVRINNDYIINNIKDGLCKLTFNVLILSKNCKSSIFRNNKKKPIGCIESISSSELNNIAFSLYTGVCFFAVFDFPLFFCPPIILKTIYRTLDFNSNKNIHSSSKQTKMFKKYIKILRGSFPKHLLQVYIDIKIKLNHKLKNQCLKNN
ncbi:hypothetical protein AGLY_006092 [Aphis glycines]|uniref:Uncharacterized protein n=1 Tax=Aphis glycines TaxID=307491 RepID=A0A6G0TTP1_APHGL|nr:hypothetical protein AGLY_006092 [Aphis glycines]